MFTVTYEIVTEESAKHADAESRGYIAPGEWRDDEPQTMTLREAIRLLYYVEPCDNGTWYGHAEQDCRTGHWESRDLHAPRNITQSSVARVTRALAAAGYARA